MARVIPFDSLRPGMTVWEDWHYGTGCLQMEIVAKTPNGKMIAAWHDVTGKKCGVRVWLRPSREYRYWSDEPTLEERELTPWQS